MQIYRWYLQDTVILQSNLLHDKGTEVWGKLHLLTFKTPLTELKQYIHHSKSRPVSEIQAEIQIHLSTRLGQTVLWCLREADTSNFAYEAVTDVLRTRHEQLSYDKYRSSDRTCRSSVRTCKSTFGSIHRSTSRSAEHSTCQDLQDLQEIYKQICRQCNIGESRQSINSSFRRSSSISDLCYSQENAMAHLVGIDTGPVLDWTDDNGLLEHFRKWKKRCKFSSKVL